MMLSKNMITAIIGGVILAAVLGCGVRSKQICRGEIAFGGRIFKGMAGNVKRTKMATCTKYCIEGDPAVGKVYMNWAKSQTDPEKRQMSIYDAMTFEKTIADAIRACEPRCLSDVESRRLNMEMKCEVQ